MVTRLYDFTNGTTANADEVDAELNQIINELNTNVILTTGDITKAGVLTLSSTPKMDAIAEKTGATGVTIDGLLIKDGTVPSLKKNGMICFASGFNINGSTATLGETPGTAAKCYAAWISAVKNSWFDFPKIPVPPDYDGGSIDITVCFRSAASAKKHSLGIRCASVATTETHNPDLAAAYQLYNEAVSDATAGDVTILKTTVAQANHLMVANEIWNCKLVVEDDAGCDADATLFDWILIEWNKA